MNLEFLPLVVAHEGEAMLEEWIDGQVLSEEVDDAIVRQCGRMQARLHALQPPSLDGLGFKWLEIADWERMSAAIRLILQAVE